jgi:signal transduction histidine kinase
VLTWLRTRKGYVVALQWLLTVVVAVWGASTGAWRESPTVFWALVALSATGNAALIRLPLPAFYRPVNWMYIFVADTVFVGAALYCMRGFDTGLYLPYFLIILTAALTRSVARGMLIAALVSGLYAFLVWREGDAASLLDPGLLIRLPFFFIIAIFTGYLAQSARLQQEAIEASQGLADRVRELQQLAAGIAHEVRNPLTAISNDLQAMQSRLPADGTEHGLVRDALEQVARVTRIVQETLDLARPAIMNAGWLDANRLVDTAVIDALRTVEPGRIEIRRRFAPRPLQFWGDARLLELALANILRNAAEAMPGGGALDLETAPGLWGGREIVSIRVTDTGPGIPSHQLARLYQPFYTTKAHGTGLGLSLSRKYVRAHGGELQVTSPAGYGPDGGPRGTSIRIMLPVEGATEAMAALAAAATASAADAAEEPHG